MPTATTALQDPPLRDKIADAVGRLTRSLASWLFVVQNQQQLKLVDTTAGNYAEATSSAGLNTATGRSNQNQEIVFKKISADGNTFTLNASANGPLPEGPLTLTAQWAKLRIKSNGTSWYVVG
jgi:hypothetical protein